MSAAELKPEVKGLLESLRKGFSELALPPGLGVAGASFPEVLRTLGNLERRLRDGPDAPLRLALFGPTGVGKSKIFNSLLGSVVSPAGFRRPFTLRPVYSIHESHAHLVGRIDGDVHRRGGERWRDIVLIDTPDFDSVERHNREEADRVFREAEAFIFVTDVQKYADQSTWEYLDRIFTERKPVVIVLNKATTDGAERDFRSRLERRFGKGEVVVLSERPIDDATLIPLDDPALEQIQRRVLEVFGPPAERRAAMIAAFRADLTRLFATWDSAAILLERYLEGAAALRSRLEERFRRAAAALGADVSAPIDESFKAEVYGRVLERIRSIDVLRYPRRLLALPFEGLKLLASKWWPSRKADGSLSPEESTRNQVFQLLEAKMLDLAEESRADFQSEARCPLILDHEAALGLRVPHEELAELHRRKDDEFRAWLAREAKETASKLTSENKVKFILSQVIYNSIVVGVQIHTAGHFTLFEAATDGVLSPLVAKAVGMAVSSEKVGQFENVAQAEHATLLTQVLDSGKALFEGQIEARTAWREGFRQLSRGIEALRAERDTLVRAFEGSTNVEAHAVRAGNEDPRQV